MNENKFNFSDIIKLVICGVGILVIIGIGFKIVGSTIGSINSYFNAMEWYIKYPLIACCLYVLFKIAKRLNVL